MRVGAEDTSLLVYIQKILDPLANDMQTQYETQAMSDVYNYGRGRAPSDAELYGMIGASMTVTSTTDMSPSDEPEQREGRGGMSGLGFFKNLNSNPDKKQTKGNSHAGLDMSGSLIVSDGQPQKRRGPKPDSKPALTRRQELNRQAQRCVMIST